MSATHRGTRIVSAIVVAGAILGNAGCVFYKGSRPWADVSAYPGAVVNAVSDKPLHVSFDFRHYANGKPAVGQRQKRVAEMEGRLLDTLRGMGSVLVTKQAPATAQCHRLHVSLREEEKYDTIGPILCGATFFLWPAFIEVAYQCKGELRDENNQLVRSYVYDDSCKAVVELFLIFYLPFNKNYAKLITNNLYKQLTLDVAKDLSKLAPKKK